MVAKEFGFDVATIELCYDRKRDPHDTEDKLRQMWKYGTGKGVSGAPVAFVNGVKLDSFPATVDDWMNMLNSVHGEQYVGLKSNGPEDCISQGGMTCYWDGWECNCHTLQDDILN